MEMDLTEDYICEQCGLTTPVPNETCPSCGAPMSVPGGKKKSRPNSEDQSEEGADLDIEDASEGDGEESLEALREKEAQQGDEPYDDGDQPDSY